MTENELVYRFICELIEYCKWHEISREDFTNQQWQLIYETTKKLNKQFKNDKKYNSFLILNNELIYNSYFNELFSKFILKFEFTTPYIPKSKLEPSLKQFLIDSLQK